MKDKSGCKDPFWAHIRKAKEIEWIKRLRTSFLYDLSDKSLPGSNQHVRVTKHQTVNQPSDLGFLLKLTRSLTEDTLSTMNFIRIQTSSLIKKLLKY